MLSLLLTDAVAKDNVFPGVKLANPPTIDGSINESEWKDIPSADGAFDDSNGQIAPENMKFWLAYDENYIYFAFKAFDSDPKSIRANEFRTNVSLSADDSVFLALDVSGTFSDQDVFGMNSRGATQIQLAGGRAAKREWSGEFVSAGRIVDDGWETEARIPWKVIRLPSAGKRTLRFNVVRQHKRLLRKFVWQYTSGGRFEDSGKWTDVEIPKIKFDRIVNLLPYGILGYDGKDEIYDAGLDFKTQLTEGIAGVASINPDFRNVERAILSLDFSRFERLANETRPFFQEGSDYVGSQIFYSQRIDDFDVGLNFHGKITDKINFGAINTHSFGGESNFVGNITFKPKPTEFLRVSATSLTGGGIENKAVLLRAGKSFGPLGIYFRHMASDDSIAGYGQHNMLNLEYYKDGVFAYADWTEVTEAFNPRLGFVRETDYRGFVGGFEINKPLENDLIKNYEISTWYTNLNHLNGDAYRETIEGSASLRFANGIRTSIGFFVEDFEGSQDHIYTISSNYPSGNPYQYISASVSRGEISGVDYQTVGVGGAYKLNGKLQLSFSYQMQEYIEKTSLGIFGFNYDLGNDTYISGRLVSRDDGTGGYVSFRKSGNRGTEYYLIVGDPNAPKFKESIIFKVVSPFRI